MATQVPIKSELFRPLAPLAAIQQGLLPYYDQLRRQADPVLAVGALCALLDGGMAQPAMWEQIADLSRFGAIKSRAFGYFNANFEHGLARQVAKAAAAPAEAADAAAMEAELAFDAAAAARAAADRYLATGLLQHLEATAFRAGEAGGWKPMLDWLVRLVAIVPLAPGPVSRVLTVLSDANQADLMAEFADILMSRNLHPVGATLLAAGAAMRRGNPQAALHRLKGLDDAKLAANPNTAPFRGQALDLRAAALDRTGSYREAYAAYAALKAAERAPNVDPEDFFRGIAARGALKVPELPPDPRADVVQMLGFPRSGTTLLENALSAHPAIETFEEIPALRGAIDQIERVLLKKVPPPADPRAPYLAARAKYYEEIDIRRHKPTARVLIDKLPIRTADARLLQKLFPDWRYVFSIRHPFDVVLSCFRQRFVANPAMECFTTIELAARAYDASMSEWFACFALNDRRVCYVRYDELVTDFRRVMTGALEFLALPWSDEVNDFATKAEGRNASTPSYSKVRQGLSIGVQTSWRNYDFLFQTPATAPLRKWADVFGYPVS